RGLLAFVDDGLVLTDAGRAHVDTLAVSDEERRTLHAQLADGMARGSYSGVRARERYAVHLALGGDPAGAIRVLVGHAARLLRSCDPTSALAALDQAAEFGDLDVDGCVLRARSARLAHDP